MENNQNSNRNNRQNEIDNAYQNAGTNSRNQSQQYGQEYSDRGNDYTDRQQQQSYGEQNAGYNSNANRDSRTGNMNNNMYGSNRSNASSGSRSDSGYDQNRSNQNSYSESSSYSRPEGYRNTDYRNSGYRQDEYRTSNDNYNSGSRSYNQEMGRGNDTDRNDYSRTNRYNERYNNNERSNSDNDRGFWDKASDEVSSWFGDDDAQRRRQMDERRDAGSHSNAYGSSVGGHRGKGPKSYKRSDDRIKEDVNDRLSDDHHIDASHVEVSISSGEITLSGYVDSKFAKRHAEDLTEAVSGVRNVENRIRVQGDSMTVSELDNKDSKTGSVQPASTGTVTTSNSGKSKQAS